jgi:hypothetical protein
VIVIPKVPDDEPRDQPDVFELKLGNSVHFRAGFLRYEQAPPEDLMLLHGWLALEFQLASAGHVDASFLDLLRTAVNSAQRLKRDYIGADNLLAALREENSAALRLFTQHGASAAMEPDRSRDDLGSRPFTLEALRIIELALEEARSAGVKATAEHLLLSIMLEGTSTAYQALAAAGITADEVRALIKGDTAGSSE